MSILITLAVIFILLCLNELWWRKHKSSGELSRKLIHIVVGIYTAFWPFYLSFNQIKFLSLAYVIVVLVSKNLKIFESIHNVKRATWGEFCFAVSVGGIAFLTTSKWLYAASILQMALADGLAAVIGVRWGKSTRYKVFKQTKSVVGTLTFFISSLIILIIFHAVGHLHLSLTDLVLISAGASLLENIGIQGLDNILVPVFVVLLLVHH